MSESKTYLDPSNTNEILEELKNAENHNQVIDLIQTTFPTWMIGYPKKYCSDYPHLQKNWKYVLKSSGKSPLNVIIVDFLDFENPKYTLTKVFAELLSLFGHSVRRKEEFIGCNVCGDAIPNNNIYNQLKERGLTVPGVWSTKCSSC